MKHLLCFAAVMALACPVLAADESGKPVTAEDVDRQTREALQSAKSYSYEQKDEYQKRLQGVLQKLNDQIDELKRQAEQASGKARQQYQEELVRLEKLRIKAREQLARVRSATPGAWEDIKAGVSAAVEDLHNAYERAKTHFQQSK